MNEREWMRMLKYQQELHHFSRNMLLHEQKQTLTISEMELLSWLFIEPEKSTPLALTKETGMKKEAVSRCLKKLGERHFIEKELHPQDKRSYNLKITDMGKAELKENYILMLKPMYMLKEKLGESFDELFNNIGRANVYLESVKNKKGMIE